MPGLLLPTVALFALSASGTSRSASESPQHALNPFTRPDRTVELRVGSRPPIHLDMEVLLYPGLPIEIQGETKYVADLNLYRTVHSLAACDEGRLTAIVAYVDEPDLARGMPQGYAVVREQLDGGFQVLATDSDPVTGYPQATIAELGLLLRTPTVRFASLKDGSYRAIAELDFASPELSGQWIVDIDQKGVHPVLRIGRHPLTDSKELRHFFQPAPYADLADPIAGFGTIAAEPGLLAWRLDGRTVNITAALQDLPEVAGMNALSQGRFVIPLNDGSILAHFGINSDDQKWFAARISERGAEIEFFTQDGSPPALPGGSESLVPSTQRRGFAFNGGYYSELRATSTSGIREVTAVNSGAGIERFLDENSFIDFPPFEPDGGTPRIVAMNDSGDVIVSRGPYPGQDPFALYFVSPGSSPILIAALQPIEQLGIFSGNYRLHPDLFVEKNLTRDGVFVFAGYGSQSIDWATVTWSRDKGYRLLHAADDLLAIPDGTVIESFGFLEHVSQNTEGTMFFSVYGRDVNESTEWRTVIIRQPLAASTPLADLNRDGEVNLLDLNIVLQGMSSGGTAGFSGDIDFDGRVDENDLQMLLDQWGQR